MKIIVNHLTRLKPGYICVAGIDPENGQHVRPVLGGSSITTAYAAEKDGLFRLGHPVDLGRVEYSGHPPETEDYKFLPGRVRRLDQLAPAEYWQLLEKAARPSLPEIFGPGLKPLGRTAVVAPGKGRASLGCLKLSSSAQLYAEDSNHLRITFVDGERTLDLSVTDLRFYQTDKFTLNLVAVQKATEWLEAGGSLILSVGLSRAWQKPGDNQAHHWLQVNNLHFESQPIW